MRHSCTYLLKLQKVIAGKSIKVLYFLSTLVDDSKFKYSRRLRKAWYNIAPAKPIYRKLLHFVNQLNGQKLSMNILNFLFVSVAEKTSYSSNSFSFLTGQAFDFGPALCNQCSFPGYPGKQFPGKSRVFLSPGSREKYVGIPGNIVCLFCPKFELKLQIFHVKYRKQCDWWLDLENLKSEVIEGSVSA